MSEVGDRIDLLNSLYTQIYNCRKCFEIRNGNIRYDPERVPRKVFPQSLDSNLFIVGQSLAANQVRVSGVPYHDRNGNIGKGGSFLEKYLKKIDHTLSPNRSAYKFVYTSDMVQCFPGKKQKGGGDNTPKRKEIENCKEWILKEMALIKTNFILLMGRPATECFFKHFLNKSFKTLRELYKKEHVFPQGNIVYSVYVLPHPTSMEIGKSELFESTFMMMRNKLNIR